MSRYIDADELQKLFNEVSTSLLCRRELTKDTDHMVRPFIMVPEMIQDAPTADVAPVVHARWLTGEEQFPCNIPRKKSRLGVFCSACHNHSDNISDYCPHCGAKIGADTQEREGG